MPPSPSSRRSPAKELRVEDAHRREQSLKGRFSLKGKDEDLVLFNEMQNHERDNFLLPSFVDFDDSMNFNLGINIPPRAESCELLNANSEKNDYDWLLTPPDTPLFPSLDEEEPEPVNMSRGRTRSQTASVSRTSMCEKTPRPNRSSASPCRLSPSSRSSYSVAHSRTRSSSTPRSSPPPVLRTTTPLRRSSTPPPKSSPAPRSLTPTSRRSSTSSIGQTFYGKRGASPVSTNRGSSASPKLQDWQSSVPGFSTDAPPNLRTSLTDRSASYVRGTSPAPGVGRGSASKFGRKSVSPSPSRSASSSHNSERDHCSSISKQSAPSSCEDDAESYSSLGLSSNATARSYGAYANGRAMVFSKKTSRSPTASSAPKLSFDSALRQMDRHKAPHNMFRPLLSSVPTATVYAGKTSNAHRPVFSRNSSLTASSNASSDHGVAPDFEDSEHDPINLTGEQEKMKDTEFQEEVFIFDKLDEVGEDADHGASCKKLHGGIEISDISVPEMINSKSEYPCDGCGSTKNTAAVCQVKYAAEYPPKTDSAKMMKPCLKCRKHFLITDLDLDVCEECSVIHVMICSEEPGTNRVAPQGVGNATPGPMVHPVLGMPEYSDNPSDDRSSQYGQSSGQKVSGSVLVNDQKDQNISELDLFTPGEFGAPESSSKYQSHASESNPKLIDCADNSEGTGIAVLLKHGSGGRKWPVVQGKAFSATNLLFAESSYGRDKMNNMKYSIRRDSSSASSSIDMGSYGQIEGHLSWQLSSTKLETENLGGESQGCSTHSETSNTAETTVCSRIESDAISCGVARSYETDAIEDRLVDAREADSYSGNKNLNASEHVPEQAVGCPGTKLASNGLSLKSSQSIDFLMYETSVATNPVENCDPCKNATEKILNNNEKCVPEAGAPMPPRDSSFINDIHMLSDPGCQNDISDGAIHESSVVILHQQNDTISQETQSGCLSSQTQHCLEDFHDVLVSPTSGNDVFISEVESKIAEVTCSEGTVTTEAPRISVQRSFTLEEATDTILFCSSIVHDMAYNAAKIAMEKEPTLYKSSLRPVTFVGSSVSNHNDTQKASNKSIQHSRKVHRKKLETANKMQPVELEDNVKTSDLPSRNAMEVSQAVDSTKLESKPPPKLESKCNCIVM